MFFFPFRPSSIRLLFSLLHSRWCLFFVSFALGLRARHLNRGRLNTRWLAPAILPSQFNIEINSQPRSLLTHTHIIIQIRVYTRLWRLKKSRRAISVFSRQGWAFLCSRGAKMRWNFQQRHLILRMLRGFLPRMELYKDWLWSRCIVRPQIKCGLSLILIDNARCTKFVQIRF